MADNAKADLEIHPADQEMSECEENQSSDGERSGSDAGRSNNSGSDEESDNGAPVADSNDVGPRDPKHRKSDIDSTVSRLSKEHLKCYDDIKEGNNRVLPARMVSEKATSLVWEARHGRESDRTDCRLCASQGKEKDFGHLKRGRRSLYIHTASHYLYFVCHCGARYKQADCLGRHQRKVHGGKSDGMSSVVSFDLLEVFMSLWRIHRPEDAARWDEQVQAQEAEDTDDKVEDVASPVKPRPIKVTFTNSKLCSNKPKVYVPRKPIRMDTPPDRKRPAPAATVTAPEPVATAPEGVREEPPRPLEQLISRVTRLERKLTNMTEEMAAVRHECGRQGRRAEDLERLLEGVCDALGSLSGVSDTVCRRFKRYRSQ
jgi:hypothetical protein